MKKQKLKFNFEIDIIGFMALIVLLMSLANENMFFLMVSVALIIWSILLRLLGERADKK